MIIKKIREAKRDINSFTKLYREYKLESNINHFFDDKEAVDVLGNFSLNVLLFNTKVNEDMGIEPVGFCIYKESRTKADTRITEVMLLFVPKKFAKYGIYEQMLDEVQKMRKKDGIVKMNLKGNLE